MLPEPETWMAFTCSSPSQVDATVPIEGGMPVGNLNRSSASSAGWGLYAMMAPATIMDRQIAIIGMYFCF